jgi:hypothetical protein
MSLAKLRTLAMVVFLMMGAVTVWQARVQAFSVAYQYQGFGCNGFCYNTQCLYGFAPSDCSAAEAAASSHCSWASWYGGCYYYDDIFHPPYGCEVTTTNLYTVCQF